MISRNQGRMSVSARCRAAAKTSKQFDHNITKTATCPQIAMAEMTKKIGPGQNITRSSLLNGPMLAK